MAVEQTASGRQTVTAFFESEADAQRAKADLAAAGFVAEDIVVSAGASQATGAPVATQSVFKSLLDIFIFMPPHEKPTFEEAMRRGGVVIAVQTDASSYERAIDILDRDGALDLDEHETRWRAEGWTPNVATVRPGGPGSAEQAAFETANSHDPLVDPSANHDVRERIGIGTSDMATATDLTPPSAVSGSTAVRDLSHGRTRVRSYTSSLAAPPAGIDPQI